MSHIDDLIAEYCPDGVEYSAIEDLFDIRNGYTPAKSNAEFWSGGSIPWFRMEDIRENGGVLDSSLQQITALAVKGGKLFPANSLLVATSATIGEHALVTVPHLSNQRFTSLSPKAPLAHRMNVKFVYYYGFVLDEWCRNNVTTSSFASVEMSRFRKFRFPVPPLEVQREIVRILDEFTALEAELEAELEARRQQYAFYRNQLLTFPETGGVPRVPMSEVAIFQRGSAMTIRSAVPGEYRLIANSPEPIGTHNESNRDGEFLVVARSGAGAGTVSLWEGPAFLTDAFSLHPDNGVVTTRYVYYLLQNQQSALREMKAGGGVPHVRVKDVEAHQIPVPPIEDQRRIVAILDEFDALVNDITIGLPAELAARRKQYEYYRDKLLTFKEAPHE